MRNNKGFTLVELAIVLVIIGVILGGVMKGQQLIAASKGKRIIRDFQTIQTAFFAYQDKTGNYPGNSATAPTDITADTTNTFWSDLRDEDLYSGTGTTVPTNVFGGTITAQNANSQSLAGNAICYTNIPAEMAESIDQNYDDHDPDSGDITVSANTVTTPGTTAATAFATSGNVVLCVRLEQ